MKKDYRDGAALLVVALTIMAGSATAQESTDPASRLSVHGFLTQGYGIADNNQYLGIPKEGTAAYRTAALQFKYALAPKDNFVLQLSHEVLGQSLSNSLRADIELDWAFYERKFSDTTGVRVGRVPLPIGIFNEIKDVGTVLPFYRASTGIYGDGTWTSDTIDGLVLSHEFLRGSAWGLRADVYFGNYKRIEDDTSVPAVALADISNALGAQLWLQTPVEGLRVGYGIKRSDATGGIYQAGFTDSQRDMYFSIEAAINRITARGEYYDTQYTGGFWKAYYAELLFKITDKATLMGNYERGDLKFTVPDFAVFDKNRSKDYGVGVRYAVRSDLVLKLERHWHKGYDIEAQPVDSFFGPQLKANYTLLSLSTSF